MDNEIMIGALSGLSSDYLSVALECAHDGVVIADSNAVMIYANHSYEVISGFNRSDIIGRSMQALISEGYISISGTLKVLETGEPFSSMQTFQTQRHALIVSTPVFDESGKITMVVTNLRDMTEMHQIRTELRRKELQNQHYYEKMQSLRREIDGEVEYIAVDKAMQNILRFARHVAEVTDPVLLLGEAGVGKKKLARYIHQYSSRSMLPFVHVTMTSDNPDSQLAYLFGTVRERGSQQLSGVLEIVDGGTVYFDEISTVLPEVQQKLNEILTTGTYALDGSIHKLNIRIIASTKYTLSELRQYVPEGTELYRQLALFPIRVPPLREHRDDIVPLLDYFLAQYNQKAGKSKTFAANVYRKLLHYAWPGNVAEVENMVKRVAVISEGSVITMDEIYSSGGITDTVQPAADLLPTQINLKDEVEKMEAQYMTNAFERYHNARKAAESLGMGASTFIRKRQEYEKSGLMQRGKKKHRR